MDTTTMWSRMDLSIDVVKYLRGTHNAWSRLLNGEHIFVILPKVCVPGPGDGGYLALDAAMRAKGLL